MTHGVWMAIAHDVGIGAATCLVRAECCGRVEIVRARTECLDHAGQRVGWTVIVRGQEDDQKLRAHLLRRAVHLAQQEGHGFVLPGVVGFAPLGPALVARPKITSPPCTSQLTGSAKSRVMCVCSRRTPLLKGGAMYGLPCSFQATCDTSRQNS